VILTCVDIPEEIKRLKVKFQEKFKAENVEPLDYGNILHITAARIKKLATNGNSESILKEYRDFFIQLRHQISGNPLRLKIAGLNKTDSYDLLTNPKYEHEDSEN